MTIGSIFDAIREDASRLERAREILERDPENISLQVLISALEKRVRQARERILFDAAANQVNLLQYRVVNRSDIYSISTVAESISFFQKGFTALHDAVVNGPKDRARFSREIISETQLHIGYTFPGSFGFMLALAESRDLFEGKFDRSIDALADFLRIQDTDDAIECSRSVGLAATSKLYDWVTTNLQSNNSVDYQWRRSDDIVKGEFIDLEIFENLKIIFDEAKDLETQDIEVVGTLVGIDMDRLSFHFVSIDGESFRGDIGNDVASGEYTVPHRYIARMVVSTTVLPATAERKEAFKLVWLSD